MDDIGKQLELRAQTERPFKGVTGVEAMFKNEGFDVETQIHTPMSATMVLKKDGQTYEIDCSYMPPPKTAAQLGGEDLAAATAHRDHE